MNLTGLLYIGLVVLVILMGIMVQISKYGWRSRKWTIIFAIVGAVSFTVLLVMVMVSA